MSARTTCRICESACGLLAEIADGRVVSLRPDPDHPASRGHACGKGLRFAAKEGRIERPRLRSGATWHEVSWDAALADVGARLAAIRAAHGPDAIGVYSGNAVGHSFGAILGVEGFVRGIGTRAHYSCLTLDNAPQYAVVEQCLGNPLLTLIPDYAGADFAVLAGTDPLASQPSQAQSNPGGVAAIRALARSGALAVVDPRRSPTARAAALHLKPRPGTDVAWLAWLVRERLARGPIADPLLAGVEALAAAVAPFTAEVAASATGLRLEDLAALRDRLFAAERPLVASGLGILLGPDGSVGWWLTLALQALLGGLDRAGGWRLQPGAPDLPRWARRLGLRAADPANLARVSRTPAVLGTWPAADLARDGDLRALVVVGGNPAVSLPNTAEARRALARLELLVVCAPFGSETAALAHAVLPTTTWLERAELAVHTANQRPAPYLERVRAVVPAPWDTRDDLEILRSLCRATGRAPFGSAAADALVGRLGAPGVALAALAASAPRAAATLARRGAVFGPERPGLRVRGTDHADRKVHLAPAALVGALRVPAAPPLALVTSVRPADRMNTWLGPARGAPEIALHPEELAARGVAPGGAVWVSGAGGELRAIARGDPTLALGAAVLAFSAGANEVVGSETREALTSQPVSNGAGIAVRPATPG